MSDKKEISLDSHKENIARLAQIAELKELLSLEEEQIKEKIQSELPLDSIGLIEGKKVCTFSKVAGSITVSFSKLPKTMQDDILAQGLATQRKESTSLRFDWKNITSLFEKKG